MNDRDSTMRTKLLMLIVFISSVISELNGSTYYVSPDGEDSYTKIQAQNPATPWRSITKAASIVVAGDRIIVKEGTYHESDIEFTHSGNSSNWITITNEPGSKPVITGSGVRGILILGEKENTYTKSHFVINGLTFRGYQNDGISIFYADYIICSNIHAYDNGDAGILVVDSDHIVVQDSELHHNGWKSSGDSGWGDGLTINNHKAFGKSTIVRRNVMYANWQKRAEFYWDGNGLTLDMAGTGGVHIIANNVFFNNGGCGVLNNNTGNMAIVHNVLFRNMADYNRCRNEGELHLTQNWVDNTLLKNNIIYSRLRTKLYSNLRPIVRDGGVDSGEDVIENNLIWGENGENTIVLWFQYRSVESWISDKSPSTLTGDPGFVSAPFDNEFTTFHGSEWIEMNIDDYDFKLRHDSQCIDKGTFLTKTTAGGSGREISVETARYFTDGFGIEDQGDVIQVGLNTPVRITFIDYDNNIITVNQNVSWNNGDGVSLLYYGTAPDIGAYEYTLQYLPHQSYDIHATITLTRPITWGDKTISILLTTSKRVIKVPTPLILNECDGSTTDIPLEGEIPGQNFFGNLKLDDSIADGPACFLLPKESLIGIEGSVGNTIIQEDSIYIDQTSPISPLSIEIKK